MVLAAGGHEQSLIEQSLFGGETGAVKNEVGQRLVGYLGGTAQHHFTPFSGLLNLGYGSSAIWIHLRLAADAQPVAQDHILRIRPPYLDRIELYDPLEPARVRVVGDRYGDGNGPGQGAGQGLGPNNGRSTGGNTGGSTGGGSAGTGGGSGSGGNTGGGNGANSGGSANQIAGTGQGAGGPGDGNGPGQGAGQGSGPNTGDSNGSNEESSGSTSIVRAANTGGSANQAASTGEGAGEAAGGTIAVNSIVNEAGINTISMSLVDDSGNLQVLPVPPEGIRVTTGVKVVLLEPNQPPVAQKAVEVQQDNKQLELRPIDEVDQNFGAPGEVIASVTFRTAPDATAFTADLTTGGLVIHATGDAGREMATGHRDLMIASALLEVQRSLSISADRISTIFIDMRG